MNPFTSFFKWLITPELCVTCKERPRLTRYIGVCKPCLMDLQRKAQEREDTRLQRIIAAAIRETQEPPKP